MNHLAAGAPEIELDAGHIRFHLARWPLLAQSNFSYDAIDPPLASEEDEEGNIVPTAALDDQMDDMEDGARDDTQESGDGA